MKQKDNIANSIRNTVRMIRFNLKIIFAGRFVWFLLAAFAFILLFAIQTVRTGQPLTDGTV